MTNQLKTYRTNELHKTITQKEHTNNLTRYRRINNT